MAASLPDNPALRHAERPRTPTYAYVAGAQPLPGYTIKRGLGQGGFGEVYYAVTDAGKEVALKVVRRNLDVELRGVTQCLNLKHPNLVGLYDVRTDAEDNYWIVMEYVAGERLVDFIERHPQGAPPAEALRIARGIAAGVAYLHDNGIVHRDLKPANIFIENGFVKICDYGLSKFISVSRRSGQTESVGTVHYMAPEIANGRYGKQIDVYALGILLYELLTGRVPFDGESVGEILMKHLTAEPDLKAAPEPYRRVIAKALEKDPERRTKSVEEFLEPLEGESERSSARQERAENGRAEFERRHRRGHEFCDGASRGKPGSFECKTFLDTFRFGPAESRDHWRPWVWLGACFFFPPLLALVIPCLAIANRSVVSGWTFPWHRLLLAMPVVGLAPLIYLFRSFEGPLDTSSSLTGSIILATIVLSFFAVPLAFFILLEKKHPWPESVNRRSDVVLASAVRQLPEPPGYWRALIPFAVLVPVALLLIGSDGFGFGDRPGRAPLWVMLAMPLAIATGFALWTADWVRRRRSAYFDKPAAAEGRVVAPHSSSGWGGKVMLVTAIATGIAVVVGYASVRESQVHVAQQEAAKRAAVETLLRKQREFERSGKSAPQSSTVVVVPNQPTPTPAESFTGFSVMSIGLVGVVVLSALLMFWLARRGHDHYDPTAVLASKSELAVTLDSGDVAQARGPPTSWHARAIDLTGGWLLLFAATVVGVRFLLLFRSAPFELSQYLWAVASTFTAAALFAIVLKSLDRRRYDGMARRGISLCVGLAAGAAAWFYADYLGLTLPFESPIEGVGLHRWPECYKNGSPTILAFLGYFGLSFFVVDWWGLTSSRRRTRWSWTDSFVAVFWAFAVHMVFPFPQWWGVLVVAGCATVLPWAFPLVPRSERVRMRVNE